ncbi:SPOR domain-containing protein [Candidatus Ichthyocystis hellenicum]|uniref:SPOR domain-containing protein n=1 Tax=Candidatus Ichthyocystis hellenicum TaxID=1561003 RepID=UPI001112B0E7|nr:SPOR domain-containing protein [Candidatus Ichthyocystis hellenicum]
MKHRHCRNKIRPHRDTSERGGNTIVSLFIGILVGLGVALTVALYINFSQLPFLTKIVGHIVGTERKGDEKSSVDFVQGVDILGGRPFPSEENSSDHEPDVGAPVEHLNFYENKEKNHPAPRKETGNSPTREKKPVKEDEDNGHNSVVSKQKIDGPPDSNNEHLFYVLIESFRSIEKADDARAHLALAGISASIHGAIDPQSQTIIHQLRIGPFKSQEQAADAQEQLRSHSLAGEIIAN